MCGNPYSMDSFELINRALFSTPRKAIRNCLRTALNKSEIEELEQRERLIQTIDKINKQYGRKTITWAACGLDQNWQMRFNRRSNTTTTNTLPIKKYSMMNPPLFLKR